MLVGQFQHSGRTPHIDGFVGHLEYGCSISQEKTLINFDYCDAIVNVVEPSQKSRLDALALYKYSHLLLQHFLGVDIPSICEIYLSPLIILDIMAVASNALLPGLLSLFKEILGICNTLTVERGRKPGATFAYKMLQ